MERKIGEIFEYNGEWYQCVEGNCAYCSIQDEACEQRIINDVCRLNRIFKKLEKVGEPYVAYGKVRQQYKLHAPLTITKGIIDKDMSCDDVNLIVDIELKQIKENMEDLDKIKVRDYTKVEELNVMEENKLNLKPFDIQKAREGKPVCTRDGRKVRIICFDSKNDPQRPIVALVEHNDNELLYEYTIEGKDRFSHISTTGTSDLMMLPEKKEGWIVIHKEAIYDKETAEKIARETTSNVIKIQKIEWEE